MKPIVTERTALKLVRLEGILQGLRPLAIAFSGGVDSSALLAVAQGVLDDDLIAVTGVSPSLSRHQLDQAARVARTLGVTHRLLRTDELQSPSYAANPVDRCYFCKDTLYDRLAASLGSTWPHVADGSNADDVGDHRPGREAARRHGVRSPLEEAGITKAEVRAISRRYGLETAEYPASPCLASRIPYGTVVTEATLGRVERGEAAVRALGFREFRVRHFGSGARIEVGALELHRLDDPDLRRALVRDVERAGPYASADVDERPLLSGRLNEGIA